MPSAIVLVIDGLGAKHIGPYGNTWIETPAFNRLASESLLIQGLYAPFAGCQETYESLLGAKHAVASDSADGLISSFSARGVVTRLFTDAPELTDLRWSGAFADQMEIDVPTGLKLADAWDETHTARFFAQAITAVEEATHDNLLWLHTGGFGNPWDAPYEFRSLFSDEEDPEPSGSAQVPSLELDQGYDPDTLHEIRCAFAGQVTLVDRCLEVLLSVIRERSDTLFVVTSPRGFPLGEHRVVGWKQSGLYHELLHVPALVRYPDRRQAMQRRLGLSEIRDVASLIEGWFEGTAVGATTRSFSISRNNDELLLRTPVWHQRFPHIATPDNGDSGSELYVKPDDQNEVNDVSDRCANVAGTGREFVESWLRNPHDDVPVPELLMVRPE